MDRAGLWEHVDRLRAWHTRCVSTGEARALHTPADPAWLLPAAFLACVVACLAPVLVRPWAPLSIVYGSVPLTAAAGLTICLYARMRFAAHPRLIRFLIATILCSAGLLGAAVFSFDGVALSLPLRDDVFLAFDRALGFDWPATMAWLDKQPLMLTAFRAVYATHGAQVVLAIFAMSVLGRPGQLARFLLFFMVSAMLTVMLAALFPSVGPVSHYPAVFNNLTFRGTVPLDLYNALRDGRLATVNLDQMTGLVTFPSFHMVILLIVPWALRPWRWLFWPLFAIDALVLIATITEGGHYLADLVGGGCVFLVSIALVKGAIALSLVGQKAADRPADGLTMPAPVGA